MFQLLYCFVSVAVVVAFLICWAPFHTQRLLSIYNSPSPAPTTIAETALYKISNTGDEGGAPPNDGLVISEGGDGGRGTLTQAVQTVLYYVSGVLYYVSAVINPILYNIMSLKFRQSFRSTVFRPFCRRDGDGGWGSDAGAEGQGHRPHASVVQTYRFQNHNVGTAGGGGCDRTNLSGGGGDYLVDVRMVGLQVVSQTVLRRSGAGQPLLIHKGQRIDLHSSQSSGGPCRPGNHCVGPSV